MHLGVATASQVSLAGWERVVQQSLINGRYEILRELGAGGCGCVYAATDRTTENHVAIKLFGHHIRWDRTAREKFEIEVKVSGRVKSEHVVQVLDAGVDATTQLPYLVMELLNGKNLQTLIEQDGRLGPALTVEYLKQVASGLNKAHAWTDSDGRIAPIVHRDLKPSNLFLTHHEDGAPLVKILDWGIAKVLSTSATLSGDIRCTPLYMAPEQVLQTPVTPATDIWQLGLVTFFLLTGESYWRSGLRDDAVLPAIIKEVCEGPSVSPRIRARELHPDLVLPLAFDDWFMRCVNLDPARRFPNAGDAVRALATALEPLAQESPGTTAVGSSNSSTLGISGELPQTMEHPSRPSPSKGVRRPPTPTPASSAIKHHRRKLAWIVVVASVTLFVAAQLGLTLHRSGSPIGRVASSLNSHSTPIATALWPPQLHESLAQRAGTVSLVSSEPVPATSSSPSTPAQSPGSNLASPKQTPTSTSKSRQTPKVPASATPPVPSNGPTSKNPKPGDKNLDWVLVKQKHQQDGRDLAEPQ